MDAQQQQLVAELRRVQDLVLELDLRLHAPSYSADQCRRIATEIAALTDRSILAAASATPPCSGAPSPLSDAGSEPFRGGAGGSPRRAPPTTATAGASTGRRTSSARLLPVHAPHPAGMPRHQAGAAHRRRPLRLRRRLPR
jgi:hypothetical protein